VKLGSNYFQLYEGCIAQISAIPLRMLGSLNHGWSTLPLTGQTLRAFHSFVARTFRTKELESLESCLWDSVVNGLVKKGGW